MEKKLFRKITFVKKIKSVHFFEILEFLFWIQGIENYKRTVELKISQWKYLKRLMEAKSILYLHTNCYGKVIWKKVECKKQKWFAVRSKWIRKKYSNERMYSQVKIEVVRTKIKKRNLKQSWEREIWIRWGEGQYKEDRKKEKKRQTDKERA